MARRRGPLLDPAEQVALVARAKREALLRAHRHRLRREDLEDCYSQATLELIVRARNARSFASAAHVANALEQRFVSRVQDCRRALNGRSPIQAALERGLPLGVPGQRDVDIADARAEVEELVLTRMELRRVIALMGDLTHDQRAVLAAQALHELDCETVCRAYGWSAEKHRKVAQRARARLRRLCEDADG